MGPVAGTVGCPVDAVIYDGLVMTCPPAMGLGVFEGNAGRAALKLAMDTSLVGSDDCQEFALARGHDPEKSA